MALNMAVDAFCRLVKQQSNVAQLVTKYGLFFRLFTSNSNIFADYMLLLFHVSDYLMCTNYTFPFQVS